MEYEGKRRLTHLQSNIFARVNSFLTTVPERGGSIFPDVHALLAAPKTKLI
jgi:hypothetical protein